MKKYCAILILAAALLGCKENVIEPNEEPITAEPLTIEADIDATTTQSVTVRSEAAWSVISSAEWCMAQPSSGSAGETVATLTFDQNRGRADRTRTLTFSTDLTNTTVTVNQQGDYIAALAFADATFKAELLSLCDSDSDGEVSSVEAASITKIVCSTDAIASVEGIDQLPNLTYIHLCGTESFDAEMQKKVGNGQLTELDLSGNPNLKYLYCNNNKLTSMNLNGCTALEWLECFGNRLTMLDISSNSALRLIYCDNNFIDELPLTTATSLVTLRCGNNLISELDVSDTAITFLDCSPMQSDGVDCLNKLYVNDVQWPYLPKWNIPSSTETVLAP